MTSCRNFRDKFQNTVMENLIQNHGDLHFFNKKIAKIVKDILKNSKNDSNRIDYYNIRFSSHYFIRHLPPHPAHARRQREGPSAGVGDAVLGQPELQRPAVRPL